MTDSLEGLDDIDRTILRILAQDPRIPYSDIVDRLEEEGHEMSSEGIRYRVSNLYESTSILLLTAPKEHGWEVMRLFIDVDNAPDAKEETFQSLSEMSFWMTCMGMGTFDLYAVATVQSNRDADELVNQIRGLEHVTSVEHAMETDRNTDVDDYLSL
jgi:DNA-binding Lrp family transcriptional regulator